MRPLAFSLSVALLLAAGCGPSAPARSTAEAPASVPSTAAPAALAPATPAPTAARSAESTSGAPRPTTTAEAVGNTRIVNRTTGWPRQVETPLGVVTVEQKPQRIHTLSIGFDEITFALVDPGRVVAVGKSTTNPDWSNVADLAANGPKVVGRDAEEVIAATPDLVVASKFAKEDLVRALDSAGIRVVVADIPSAIDALASNIRLFAYLYGEEERGERLIQEAQQRLASVDAVVEKKPVAERPRVLMLIGNNFTPGVGSNEDKIIRRAGGINLAAEAGIEGNKQLSLESIPALNPDLILLAEQDAAARQLEQTVLGHPALQELPAVKEKRYHLVTHRYITTLSHWNVRGVEELARLFYPKEFE